MFILHNLLLPGISVHFISSKMGRSFGRKGKTINEKRRSEIGGQGSEVRWAVFLYKYVGGVFNDGEVVTGGNDVDGVEFGGEDGFGACGDGRFDLVGIDVEVVGPDVHQHRFGVEITHEFGRSSEGVGKGMIGVWQ